MSCNCCIGQTSQLLIDEFSNNIDKSHYIVAKNLSTMLVSSIGRAVVSEFVAKLYSIYRYWMTHVVLTRDLIPIFTSCPEISIGAHTRVIVVTIDACSTVETWTARTFVVYCDTCGKLWPLTWKYFITDALTKYSLSSEIISNWSVISK